MFPGSERIVLFIDGADLYAAARALQFDIDAMEAAPRIMRLHRCVSRALAT
jgi:hypothetical protein